MTRLCACVRLVDRRAAIHIEEASCSLCFDRTDLCLCGAVNEPELELWAYGTKREIEGQTAERRGKLKCSLLSWPQVFRLKRQGCFSVWLHTPVMVVLKKVSRREGGKSIWTRGEGKEMRRHTGRKREVKRKRQWLSDYCALSWLYLFCLDDFLDVFCSLNSK